MCTICWIFKKHSTPTSRYLLFFYLFVPGGALVLYFKKQDFADEAFCSVGVSQVTMPQS